MITPECVSRIGDHSYAATKRSALGSILRGTVKVQNIDGYGEICDKMRIVIRCGLMRIVEPKAEDDILRCFMHTSTHAARNHRERVGAIVAHLFEQTTDMEMEFIKGFKAEVFGVEGWAPIMAKDHPALQELFKSNAGEPLCPVLCLALFKDSQRCPLLYADEKFDGVLFEKNSSEKSVLGQMIELAQTAFVLLLGECLHLYTLLYTLIQKWGSPSRFINQPRSLRQRLWPHHEGAARQGSN